MTDTATLEAFRELHVSQEHHPVVPTLPLRELVALGPEQAVQAVNDRMQIIEDMQADPLLHGYDPPAWRMVDLMVARKRLEKPGAALEVFLLGGHDSGKTNGWTQRLARHFWFSQNAWVWGLHSTEPMSRSIQQARFWTYFPRKIKAKVNRRGGLAGALDTKMKYTEAGGFTNMEFNIRWAAKVPWDTKPQRCGGKMEFKVYGGEVGNLQGSKLSAATSDELVSKDVAKTVRQRITPRAKITKEPWFLEMVRRCVAILEDVDDRGFPKRALPPELQGLLYTGVHGMGFTPIDGYSPLVASAMDGAMLVQERPAIVDVPEDEPVPESFPCTPLPGGRKRVHVLPILGEAGELIGDNRVPVAKQPLQGTRLIVYLPTDANPWTNVGGKLEELDGASEDDIRVTYFGDVRKQWDTVFANFNATKHVVTWEQLRKECGGVIKGTVTEVVDPGARKPWVIGHYLTVPSGRSYKVQEWPCPSIAINGTLPGAWAVSSEHGLRNGDAGPAQKKKLNWGRAHYIHLLWQLRQRLFRKFTENEGRFEGDAVSKTLTWKDRAEWKLEGEFVLPRRSLIDSRFAQHQTETMGDTKPLIEAMYDEENAIDFEPSSGVNLSEGDTLIITELADNGLGMPNYQVLDECENTIFMYGTYAVPETSDKPTRKDDKCKDFRDTDAYFELSGPQFVDRKVNTGRGWGGW